MQKAGIYILTNKVNGKQYVGKDTQLPSRIHKHLAGNAPECSAIHNAIKKHGASAFTFKMIAYPNISNQLLSIFEQSYIAELHTYQNGYNQTRGGEGSHGYKHSDEAKGLISKAKRGKRNPKVSKLKKGKKRPDITGKNNPMSDPEIARKNAQAKVGKKRPDITGENHPAKKPKVRKKMSDSGKRAWQDPTVRYKRSEGIKRAWRKRKHNPNQLKLF